MPSARALPLSALLLYGILMVFFQFNANEVHANALKGFLVSWTPILIIAGAIFLFKTMEVTGGLAIIKQWLNQVSDNKVAQIMIVGWSFVFLLEVASGFGTPAAIAAPVLVGLGFPPVRIAILCLIMNAASVTFGAVGTPTWFGFSTIALSNAEILDIGFKTAILNSIAAMVVPLIALTVVFKRQSVIKNLLFIWLSVIVTVLPHLIIAKYNYEFP